MLIRMKRNRKSNKAVSFYPKKMY